MVLAEGLASLAGRTVVAAAVTDAWGTAKRGFARLLGLGDAGRTELAERRLEQTREELAGVSAAELERAQSQLEATWQTRLLDLLEEHPEMAAELQALVEQVGAQLPAGVVSAAGHGVAAGRDVNIGAWGGGVAAWTVHGNVTPGSPTGPGPATQ
jgi:multidrug resistance efflux pump